MNFCYFQRTVSNVSGIEENSCVKRMAHRRLILALVCEIDDTLLLLNVNKSRCLSFFHIIEIQY